MTWAAGRKLAAGARVVAVLAFAASILLEPAVDTKCHMGAVPGSAQVAGDGTPLGGSEDPCGSACVPDCYCCSTPLATVIDFDPPSAVLVTVSETLPPNPLDGVLAVPDLPPIA